MNHDKVSRVIRALITIARELNLAGDDEILRLVDCNTENMKPKQLIRIHELAERSLQLFYDEIERRINSTEHY